VRGLVLRLLALGAGLALALVAGELALPFVVDRGACGGQLPFWRPDARVGWALVPGAARDAVVCDERGHEVGRHRVEVNADGLRDRARRRERTTGTPRVLVLGDSYVEAMQVDFDDTFLARLEARLGVEMLNAGVSGYATDNELRAFDVLAPVWRPDAVALVVFVGNDVMENGPRLYLKNPHGLPPKPWIGLPEQSAALARCYAGARAAARVADATPGFVWDASRVVRWSLTAGTGSLLTRLCDDAAGPRLVPGQGELFGVYGPPETDAWQEAWALTEEHLVELASHVKATGARFAVVLAPWQVEYDPTSPLHKLFPARAGRPWDFDYPEARLGAYLGTHDVAWMSLRPALAAHHAATGRTGAYAWDGHWDADGHAVVATALEPLVASLVGRR
jgi:hypothetical protein